MRFARTNLVLVSNADVAATTDVDKSKLLDLGPLKATGGAGLPIPADIASGVMDGCHTDSLGHRDGPRDCLGPALSSPTEHAFGVPS